MGGRRHDLAGAAGGLPGGGRRRLRWPPVLPRSDRWDRTLASGDPVKRGNGNGWWAAWLVALVTLVLASPGSARSQEGSELAWEETGLKYASIPRIGLTPACGVRPRWTLLCDDTVLDADPSTILHDGVAAAAQTPAHRRRRRLDGEHSAVDPFEVTPHAERRDVVGRVVATVRSEHQVMRGHIAPRAHRTRALKEVALVDLRVRRSLPGALPPHSNERQTNIAKKASRSRSVSRRRTGRRPRWPRQRSDWRPRPCRGPCQP